MNLKIGGLILSTIMVGAASAQTEKPSEEGLLLLKHDLRRAANEMAPCLPIYEGHLAKVKNAVHEARVIVDSMIAPVAIAATPVKAEVKTGVKTEVKQIKPVEMVRPASKEAPKKLAPVESAKAATKESPKMEPPKAEAPKVEAPKLTEVEKIAKSQARLRKGLVEIEKTIKDVKAASGVISDAEKASKLEKLLQTAEDEAKISISLHEKEG